ncbi:MAG TPA: diguanylate cyclase [Anaerolineaceae bacterium]|nr:diguanylate cyclase [Anaerolineaceae bacterium]HPN50447.1 diguanylate cyclase [Anaerolineaceae bacterium]
MTVKLRLLTCKHFMPELEAVLRSGALSDVEAGAFPAVCLNPQRVSNVIGSFSDLADANQPVIALMGGCFMNYQAHLRQMPPNYQVRQFAQCFNMLAPQSLIDDYTRSGAYLLTPGWLSAWRGHLKVWGFDQKTASDFFHESADHLLLLDTEVDPLSREHLKDMAAYLGMPYKVVSIGLDFFRLTITQIVLEWRHQKMYKEAERAKKKTADYMMSLDLLTGLVGAFSEKEVIEKIVDLFFLLCASPNIVFIRIENDTVKNVTALNPPEPEEGEIHAWLENCPEPYGWLDEEEGFYLRLNYQEEWIGFLHVTDIPFPEFHHDYLNLAVSISSICSLAINDAHLFDKIKQMASTDALTGLNNRRQLMVLAEINFNQARRYKHPLSLIIMDIDHFKAVNDTYGHSGGDLVLSAVARSCSSVMRDSDVQGRYGGEEFLFLLPETDLSHAIQAAERIRNNIESLEVPVEGRLIKITVSLGVAELDDDCADLDALIIRCDKALYKAKNSGRNRVVAWSAEIPDFPSPA